MAITKSYVKYNVTAATTALSIPFPFADPSHISVTTPGTWAGTWTVSTALMQIQFSPAILTGEVLIRRNTPAELIHVFVNLARFNFKAVDENFTRCLYWFQEARDAAELTDAAAVAGDLAAVREDVAALGVTSSALEQGTARALKLPSGSSVRTTVPVAEPKQLLGWDADASALTNIAQSAENTTADDTGGRWSNVQAFIAYVLSGAGAGAVGWVLAAVGAAKRSILDRLQDTVSLLDFMTPAQIADVRAGTHLVDVTAPVQAAIDHCISKGKTLRGPAGAYLVGPLDWNGTEHATPANSQWAGLRGFKGDGRLSTVFVARAGAYPTNQYVISAKNLSGVSFSGFGVDGAGVTTQGIDLSWNGGSGSPTAAPSNQNVFKDIFCQGCSTTAFNLTQCHDSKISGLWCRGVAAGNPAVVLSGAGGKLGVDNLYISTGRLVLSCQNAALHNCGFFGGVELAGSGYNVVHFSGCHVYPDTSTGFHINSTATGNATRGVLWTGCYFDAGATHTVAGRYWNGMLFEACKFQAVSSSILHPSIATAAGSGSPPAFKFEMCDFDGVLPVAITGVATVSLYACRNSGGSAVTDLGPITTGSSITATAERNTFAGSTIIDAVSGTNLSTGSSVTLKVSSGTFLLAVSNISAGGANVRTNTLFFVGTFQGDGFTATSVASSTGSGGGRTFTVTQPASGTIVITNTSAGTTHINAALIGVGF